MGLKKPHLQWNSLCASLLCFLTGKYLLVSGSTWFELKLIKEILCRTCSDCSVVQHLEGEGSPKKIKSFFLFRWNSRRASSNGRFTALLLHVLPNAAASSPPVPSHHLSQLTLLLSGKINSYSREETSLEIHFLPLFFFFNRRCPRIVTLKSFSPFVSQVNPRACIIIHTLSGIRRTARIVITELPSLTLKRRGELMRLDRGVGGWEGGPRRGLGGPRKGLGEEGWN